MILIVRCFYISELAEKALPCLTGIVHQAPKYLARAGPESLSTLLTSPQAQSYVLQLRQGRFENEAVHFVDFVTSLLDLHDLSSPESFQDQNLGLVLSILQNMLYTPGTAVVVDEVCHTVLDAFNQIVDGWGDWVGSNAADQYLEPLINEACMQYAVKIQYPVQGSEDVSHSWESDDRAQFQDFRNDVQDLLLASYACVGPVLIENLAARLHSLDLSSGWEGFEARLYCLGALSDVISNNTAELGGHISGIFTSQKWNHLIHNADTAPDLARQGAIKFISRNTFISQRDKQHLLPCINFLFASLRLPGSTASASRAIYTLCHKQRSMLLEALPQFINSITGLADIPSEDRNRLFGAVAAIVQSTPTEDGKVAPLVRIFNLISQCSEAASYDPGKDGLVSAVDLLQTLAAVGKGLRAPPEQSINLDAQSTIEERNFWVNGDGRHVQQNAMNAIDRVLARYPKEPLIIEAMCDILKCGYTETHPSPFKFDAKYSASFFANHIQLDSPRTGVIIDTASSFLASHVSNPSTIRQEFLDICSAITRCQRDLLHSFTVTTMYNDNEFTYTSLEYFTRTLPGYAFYFSDKIMSGAWQILFEFALLAFENPDTLPRRSSAQFWVRQSLPFLNSPWTNVDGGGCRLR